MIGGRNPEPTILILGNSVYRLVQGVGCGESVQVAGVEEGEPLTGSDPKHSRRIDEERIDILRRQSICGLVSSPAARRHLTQAVRRPKPDRSFWTLGNRRHRVRRQTICGCVIREVSILQSADAARERAGPNRAVATFENRINAIFCQAVGVSIRLRTEYALDRLQMRQSSLLAPEP